MGRCKHLTIGEREDIMCMRREGRRVGEIAREIGRDKSTVSRELRRNSCERFYRASTAQRRYEARRERCRRPRLLDDPERLELVRSRVLEGRWSPEQLEGRILLERPDLAVSDTTIYREVAAGRLDRCIGGRRASARLRRRGRRRRSRDGSERRGRIKISHEVSERPPEADGRSRAGDWEGDTVAGRAGGACPVTMVDRATGFLAGGKAASKRKGPVREAMVAAMRGRPCETVTLDRGKEFAEHALFTEAVGAECYFCLPHHPWQRGTNENTNGPLRQYFPKGGDLGAVPEAEVQMVYDELNRRPRERLGWRTPYEAYHSVALHLL